jgi:hypothetical protein
MQNAAVAAATLCDLVAERTFRASHKSRECAAAVLTARALLSDRHTTQQQQRRPATTTTQLITEARRHGLPTA